MAVSLLRHINTTIINLSITDQIFPTAFKQALVTPILKKVTLEPDNNDNSRPKTNFSFISKVLEKVVAKQLATYLQQNGLQEPFQSAYRQGNTTENALLRVHNDIVRALGERKVVFITFPQLLTL